MAAGHSWSTILVFAFHLLLFLPLKFVFGLFRRLFDLFEIRQTRESRFVDVRRVLWRHRLCHRLGDSFNNVLHVHARYERAHDFAWNDPRVHLYSIDERDVVFIRTKEGVNIFDSNVSSFAFRAVTDFAVEFAVMSVDAFRALAEEVAKELKEADSIDDAEKASSKSTKDSDKEDKTVVWMACHPRSGGTLIIQHFEDLPNAVVINEPSVFVNLYAMAYERKLAAPPLLKHAALFVCKSLYRSPGVGVVAIKIPNFVPWMLRDVMDLESDFPFNSRYVFGYRKPVPSMDSLLRIMTEHAAEALSYAYTLPVIGRFFPDQLVSRLGQAYGSLITAGIERLVDDEAERAKRFRWTKTLDLTTPDKTLTTRSDRDVELPVGAVSLTAHFYVFYLAALLTLRELKRNPSYGRRIFAIRYEDLMRNPEIWTTTMLPFLGLTTSAPAAAASAMQRDSQQRSFINQRRMARHSSRLAPGDVEKLDVVMRASGLAGTLAEFEHPF